MFIFLVLSFIFTTPQGIAVLLLVLYLLQYVLRCAILVASRHKDVIKTSNGRSAQLGKAKMGDIPGTRPAYLACSLDDDEVIGGNPNLITPIGPKRVTLTFHVFMPPSYEKEIPKVDMYGAIQFARTGEVRTFIPTGGRRLLVINFQEMTISVYCPKRGKKAPNNNSQEILFANYDEESHPQKKVSSGINISTRKLTNTGLEDNKLNTESAKSNEDVWDFRHFDTTPLIHYKLADLVSVAAVPPRHGGVVEIISRSGIGPCQDPIVEKDQIQHSKKGKKQKNTASPTEKHRGAQGKRVRAKSTGFIAQENEPRLENLQQYVSDTTTGAAATVILQNRHANPTEDSITVTNFASVRERCDEFAFQTPRDAAEFQRIITALRAVGTEIASLYETLEAIQESPEIHSGTTGEDAHTFSPFGVAIEDAWHCLNEISSLRKGLYQFYLRTQSEEQQVDTFDFDIFTSEKQDCEKERPLLGLIDMFNLFVPPLPINSNALPCFTPCAKVESMNEQDLLFRGIEWHYQNLSFALQLQRQVSKAAMYVRSYAWARMISNDEHLCNLKPKLIGEQVCDPNVSNEDVGQIDHGVEGKREERGRRDSQDQNESMHDNKPPRFPVIEREVDDIEDRDAFDLAPTSVSDTRLWSPPPVHNHNQGYSCVGWFVLRIPTIDNVHKSTAPDKSNGQHCPFPDPLQSIPSLKMLVERYPFASFLIYSQFIEQINTAIYFLHVRSLPVGVDTLFDESVEHIFSSEPAEREKRLGISFMAGPGTDSSFLTKAIFRIAVTVLHHELKRLVLGIQTTRREGENASIIEFLTTNLASIWHSGGPLEHRDDIPANYCSINTQFCLSKFPSTVGRLLLRAIKLLVGKATHVNFKFKLRALSNISSGRAIASNKMWNIDLKDIVATPVATPAEVKEATEFSITEDSRTNSDDTNNGTGPHELHCANIIDLLHGMKIPIKRSHLIIGEHNQNNRAEIVKMEQIQLSRSDIERYLIACNNDLKATIVRIVESCAWRGIMFPVDVRSCRKELELGQFFQQGCDKEMNPIFYYRSFLLGPWRGIVHETILAVLHRFEAHFVESESPVTIILMLDHPYESANGQIETKKDGKKVEQSADPRIDEHEEYALHSSSMLLQVFYEVIQYHYPERIAKILVVPSKSWSKAYRRSLVHSPIASRVTVLSSRDELKKYVNMKELVNFAGGKAKVASDAFSCIGSCDFAGA